MAATRWTTCSRRSAPACTATCRSSSAHPTCCARSPGSRCIAVPWRRCTAPSSPPSPTSCPVPSRRAPITRAVILEDIVDHTNVGAIFRSVAALGADVVLVTPRCADPLYRRSVRVSMGTVFQVPWTRLASWPGDLSLLRRARIHRGRPGAHPGSDVAGPSSPPTHPSGLRSSSAPRETGSRRGRCPPSSTMCAYRCRAESIRSTSPPHRRWHCGHCAPGPQSGPSSPSRVRLRKVPDGSISAARVAKSANRGYLDAMAAGSAS